MSIDINQLHGTPNGLPEVESGARQKSTAPGVTGESLIYDLRLGGSNSNGFYVDLARFVDKLLVEIELRAADLLTGYSHHLVESLREAERSRGEYGLDLLTLGLALTQYAGAAESTPGWALALAREFFWLSCDSSRSKVAELARAAIGRFVLAPRIGRALTAPYIPEKLPILIDWLLASGEFEQESRRLNNWRSFLGTMTRDEACRSMEVSIEVFDWFEREAAVALGAYTPGVPGFLANDLAHRGLRSDQIFCGRQPVEYHLSMVAVEIMNRGQQARFEQMPRKAVLLPTCMRGGNAGSCQASVFGADVTCEACDPDCTVDRITQRMRDLGAKVYVVPYAKGFNQWLERWKQEPDTGVVAVACLLNILSGGLDMRARRIPALCVPLDYPGCQRHWRREGISTGVNEERLARIVTSSCVSERAV